jgi:CRISPR-associated protein Cmx8
MNKIAQREDAMIIDYDLFSLPSAQHKAGLAGLLLMIDSLKLRKIEPVPVVENLSATGAQIAFTRESLQTVFDDLYDAGCVETASNQKRKGEEPKRIEEKAIEVRGKSKIEKRFIYNTVQPKGAFLQAFFADGDGIWIKLWRDMLWNILRGIPATRRVYEDRAEKKPSSLAGKLWNNLQKSHESRKKGKIFTESFSSSVFVGAEDANPEKVPFTGAIEYNLLLHFWPIVSLIYVPRTLSIDRSKDQGWRVERKDAGYVLAIPEPSDLKVFRDDAASLLRHMETDIAGFRPRVALIDVLEEGGLEYLYHFARNRVERETVAFSISALELFHLQKQGKRIKQLAAERVLPRANVLQDYARTRDGAANYFYKSIYLRNLLAGKAWHEGAENVLYHYPSPVFVHSRGKTPKEIRFFGIDVKKKLSAIENDLEISQQGGIMGEEDRDNQLTLRVYRLIQSYVNSKTEEKSGKRFKDFRNNKDEKKRIVYPREYREAREKVCNDAFLAMRGRRDHDFVDYFTGTICSVPQYMAEEEYVRVAIALMEDWERIKVLSMLALSAHSYLPETTEGQEVQS